ncbi:hypothetical protein PRZ48_002661 [Zasmidium cellare]|uniref:Uncharacterized protein n=1 Tax=Zasmidium cellare TaxID=395010 RepID=A0ABR0ETV3_ZASCE|nr:hypothetical protein PRZ48_002661 [Zasmidium cellare]
MADAHGRSGLSEHEMIRPSPKVIAFATSVVRSKPSELSVRDYIHLLKQHVAKGRQADAISSRHRHLDRSSYWHAEYEHAKDALKKAQDASTDLRRENEILKAKLDAAKTANPPKKRKKQDGDTIPVPRSPKKVKRAASPARNAPLDVTGLSELDETGEMEPELLRRVFDIHATVKAPGKTDTTTLAYHVIEAAAAVSQMVKQSVEDYIADDAPGLEALRSTLTVASRATASIFVGLNRISHSPEGSVVQGKVVHAIVHMFRASLAEFEWLASAEVERSDNEATSSKGKKAASSKAKSKAKGLKPTNVQGSSSLNALAGLLSNIIGLLDSKLDANKAIFEGFAYCVLRRLGRHLFTTVFGHPRAPTLEAEILQSRDDIEDDESTPSPQEKELQQKRIRVEAPYLIHLLTRTMAIAPSYLGAALTVKTGKPKQAHNKAAMKGALAITAKDCLQSTLVNAIFGTEGMDENDPFIDCLKMPIPGNVTIPVPKVKEPEMGEWFKGEMWNILGWEILSRTDG